MTVKYWGDEDSIQNDVERRENIRRYYKHKRKRKKTRAMSVMIIFMVFFVMLGVSSKLFFNLEEVNVSGTTRYSYEQVLNASGLENGQSVVGVSKEKVKRDIKNNLPYVDNVKVIKNIPSKISLVVEESLPYAYFAVNNGFLLIDEQGKALEVVSELQKDLPVIYIEGFNKYELGEIISLGDGYSQKIYVDIINQLKDNSIVENVRLIDMTKPYYIKLFYNENIEILLGQSTDIGYKLEFFRRIAVENKLYTLSEGEYRIVDVSDAVSVQASVRKAEPNKILELLKTTA